MTNIRQIIKVNQLESIVRLSDCLLMRITEKENFQKTNRKNLYETHQTLLKASETILIEYNK
jgi:hypothetical protein